MVWAGYVQTRAVPAHLRGAPDRCLVCRRIIKDLDDNDEILDDTFAILYATEHLARKLCEEPRKLEIAMFYCDHPQHIATDLTDVATPGAGVRMSRTIEAQRDFGIRRWLADTGCGRDLVQTSLALKGGGEAYVRMRAPKYFNTASGLTSIAEEMTMRMPQLDEMAEMLCCRNTPAVISIGKRCLEMGYAFFWPPFAERSFFIKPDGSQIVMDMAGNIPYLNGGNEDTACAGEEEDGPETDDEDPNVPDLSWGLAAGCRIWQRAPTTTSVVQDDATARGRRSVVQDDAASRDGNVVQDDDAAPRGDEASEMEADNEAEEIESLPTGVLPPDDDDDDDRALPRDSGDVQAVCSRDFQDPAREAFAVRHLATHKPKLNFCDTCRRGKALRAKHVRTLRKAVPEKFDGQVALDHIVARNEHHRVFKGQTRALTLADRAAGFRWGRGFRQKTGRANLEVVQQFQGPDPADKIKYVWYDAASEISYAAVEMGIRGNQDASVPGDSQGDGVAENNNQDIKMVTASLLAHAGIPLAYWPLAIGVAVLWFRTQCGDCRW
jgi:hypothetical protein